MIATLRSALGRRVRLVTRHRFAAGEADGEIEFMLADLIRFSRAD